MTTSTHTTQRRNTNCISKIKRSMIHTIVRSRDRAPVANLTISKIIQYIARLTHEIRIIQTQATTP
ncbi:hypothetical protein SAMN04490210_4518 [Pseudomonas sp. bs2935]|nr:hypothetical protein SAMN04490210_4518 [Pseudomonas sp. bs2935]